jgi:hypothetical protein
MSNIGKILNKVMTESIPFLSCKDMVILNKWCLGNKKIK